MVNCTCINKLVAFSIQKTQATTALDNDKARARSRRPRLVVGDVEIWQHSESNSKNGAGQPARTQGARP
jgi:hypothetical protein